MDVNMPCFEYPRVLSIAGSDSGGGAGIQADLKTIAALGCYGMTAITALTAQNTRGVTAIHGVPPQMLRDQIDAVIGDIGAHAVKIGMLHAPEIVEVVAEAIDRHALRQVVLDPVMVATSGDRLLTADAIETIRVRLTRLADIVTPNLPEAAVLLGRGAAVATTAADLERQAAALVESGARAALVKGGHLNDDVLTDVLASRDGVVRFTSPRIRTRNTHGTGCTLSSAIAASAAKLGDTRETGVSRAAVNNARDYLHRAIVSGAGWRLSRHPESGHGPVNHLVDQWL